MTAIFLSDVHLRDAESLKTKLVIRFLEEVASRFERVYILGDLFDVWPGTTDYLLRTFKPVLETLKRLVDTGHDVYYVEGNHDFRLGRHFTEALGIRVFPDRLEENFQGRRILMTHGDLGNPKDKSYPLLRKFLRSELVHGAARVLPGALIHRIGASASGLSRDYQQRTPLTAERDAAIRQTYRDTARSFFRGGFDVVLMGHTHLPDDYSEVVDGRSCRYFNTGDWVKHFTYLEFDGSDFYTRSHPVKNL